MTNNQKQWVAWGISTIVVLALSLTLGVKYPLPAPPDDLPDPVISLGITHFSGLTVDGDVTNIGGGTPAVAAGDNDLYVTADLEVDGEIEADGAIDADSTLNVEGAVTLQGAFYPSFTNLTVTGGPTYITPTYTIYALDSAGAVSATLQATGTEGQLLILIGDDANNVTINDTNLRSNDGAAQVLNAHDVLMLVYQDSEWLEISESNDS